MKSGPMFLQKSRKFRVYFIEFWKELLICGTYGFVFVYVLFFIYFMISLFTYMLRHVFMWLFVVTAYLFVSFLSKISKSVSFV